MPKLRRGLALALVSTCLIPCTSWAADDAASIRAIVDKAIKPVMAEHDVPGMAIAVTVDGKSYFFNYGVASKETNTPVSEATLFELGSVSKTMTGTLATYAQVIGKLSLSDHPGKYISQLKGSAIDKASLLNLGTYTAGGLPQQFPDEISKDEQINAYFRDWKPDAPAGKQRRYSNPSIGLLGHITSIALKRDFADAMETQLFPQLGLSQSYIRVPQSAMPNYAWGYDKANKAIRVNPDVFDDEAYGVKSSSSDMIRFVQMNITPEQLNAQMRSAIEATHVGHFKVGEMVQGLGWEQYPFPIALDRLLAGNSRIMSSKPNAAKQLTPPMAPSGPTLFNKTGSTGGFGNYVAFVPAKKIGIVILANKSLPGPARITAAHTILGQLAKNMP
ncbi:MAG: class C beta-lactamase [Pseudomonadota bacterium]